MDIANDKLAVQPHTSGMLKFQHSWRKTFESMRQILWNFLLIACGSAMCAVAVNGILIPHGFLSGGFVGMTLIIHYLVPALPVSLLYFMLNIPVYGLGWMYVGKRFFLYSVVGTVLFSLATGLIHIPIPVNDKMLAAIFAGIISGAGGGIILRSLGSAGGMDILSIILLKRYSIRLGTSILVLNAMILAFATYVFSLQDALYTLIFLFVSTQVLNVLVFGLSQRKTVFIISPHWDAIYRGIIDRIHRGVTILNGRGGYTGQDIQMLFTVISHQELPRLKKLINDIDNEAFVVVGDTLETMGKGIGNQPHW
jgi:uncharacterized membrane-anchored protein YitT (DUF2179 family)